MLQVISQQGTPPRFNYFQFLLGCYLKSYKYVLVPDKSPFNSFWDATGGSHSTRGGQVCSPLSIPFGMLRKKVCVGDVYVGPFNSFWDATKVWNCYGCTKHGGFQFLLGCYMSAGVLASRTSSPFNSFWDATDVWRELKAAKLITFNSFWDAT